MIYVTVLRYKGTDVADPIVRGSLAEADRAAWQHLKKSPRILKAFVNEWSQERGAFISVNVWALVDGNIVNVADA